MSTIQLPLGELGAAVFEIEDWFVGARDLFYSSAPKPVVQSFPVDVDFYDDMLNAATSAASDTVIPLGYTLAVNEDGDLVPAVPDDSLPFVGVAAASILNDASNVFDAAGDPVIGDGVSKLPVITSGYFEVAGMTFPDTFTDDAAKFAAASYNLYPGCNILIGRKLYDGVINNQLSVNDDEGGGGGGPTPFDFSIYTSVPDGLDFQSAWNHASPTDIEFTNLTDAGEVFIFTMPSVESISFPELTDVEAPGISIYTMVALTTVLLPALVNVDSIQFSLQTPNLSVFTLGTGVLKSVAGNIVLTSCALDQTSVNNLLIALAALDGTDGTTLYSGHTVAITGTSAAPTGAGATAKATLISAGNSVTTN